MRTWLKLLAVGAIVGAILDLGVFAFQLELQQNQSRTNAKSDCWSAVLDHAVQGRPHSVLEYQARQCVKLP